MQTGAICPSLALLAHSALSRYSLRRITHADRCHLPIARVARSFNAFGRHCLRRITHAHRSRCSLIQRKVPMTIHQSISQIRQLRKSTFYTPAMPPVGRSGRHQVAMVPMTYPTIHQSFSQIGQQTAEQLAGTCDQPTYQPTTLSLYIYIYIDRSQIIGKMKILITYLIGKKLKE